MSFKTSSEINKQFKGKPSKWLKGYYDGYNNPKQGLEDMNRFITSGKNYSDLDQKSKDWFDGKGQGIEDRRAGR